MRLALSLAAVFAILFFLTTANAQEHRSKSPAGKARLIIRCDDIGFCHAANMAAERLLKERGCSSMSVMVNTPWLDEAVQILAGHPEVSVGVHLTLNAEWREYRWGPVLPYTEVPSLVDSEGKFFPSRRAFFDHDPKAADVEKELRAQIRLAARKGLRVSYVDYHMGAAMSTPEFQDVVEKLAREFNLGISQYFSETYVPTVFSVSPENKLPEAIRIIEGMTEPQLYLFVCHPGVNTPELAAMTDLNPTGPKQMAVHRQAELDLLCSKELKAALARRNIELTNYSELRDAGLEHMVRPWRADPYKAQRQASTSPRP